MPFMYNELDLNSICFFLGKSDTNNLGQYFTPVNIAKLMTSYLSRHTSKGGSILDPCIGRNVFFENIENNNYMLTGIEIDENLIDTDIKKFYKAPHTNLILANFLEQEFRNKFDSIILNPPYTRQERIPLETKRTIEEISQRYGSKISKKANLYVFFILKSLNLLKKNGVLVAITYDSWLYSSFGLNFKKYILKNFDLAEIIHFKNNVFDNVDVGATILVIFNRQKKNKIKYLELENPTYLNKKESLRNVNVKEITSSEFLNFNEHTTNKNKLELPSALFQKLALYSSCIPWRGTSSPSNKYFLAKEKNKSFSEPFIKYTSPDSFSVKQNDIVYGLVVKQNHLEKKQIKTLDELKKDILLSEGSSILKKKIRNNSYWYKFPVKKGGNIIFNYYFRNNIRFILNKQHIPTLSNFYNIETNENSYSLLALLNSSLTKYAILRFAKNQGNGLKKLQLYQFNEIPILKLENFSQEELSNLDTLGKKLVHKNNSISGTHKKIDEIILKKYAKLVGMDEEQVYLLTGNKDG